MMRTIDPRRVTMTIVMIVRVHSHASIGVELDAISQIDSETAVLRRNWLGEAHASGNGSDGHECSRDHTIDFRIVVCGPVQ